MTKKEYQIEGMSCHHCVKGVEVELEELGVDSFKVEIGSAVVEYDESKFKDEQIVKAIEEAGYKVVN